jgi:hypothetical protein
MGWMCFGTHGRRLEGRSAGCENPETSFRIW